MKNVKSDQSEKSERRHGRLLRRRQVLELLQMGRSALKEAVERQDFPPPIVLFEHGRVLYWDENEILDWIEQGFTARDEAATKPPDASKIAAQSESHVSKQPPSTRRKKTKPEKGTMKERV